MEKRLNEQSPKTYGPDDLLHDLDEEIGFGEIQPGYSGSGAYDTDEMNECAVMLGCKPARVHGCIK